MRSRKGQVYVVVIAALNVIVLHAASPNQATSRVDGDPSSVVPLPGVSGSSGVNVTDPAGMNTTIPTDDVNTTIPTADVNTTIPTADVNTTLGADKLPTPEKPDGSGAGEPAKPAVDKPEDDDDDDSSSDNCWSCLLEAVEELCSFLTDWTGSGSGSNKIPSVNLYSLFHAQSSEESTENSADSGAVSGIASLFRFRRSVEDATPVEEEAFLDLLHGFYMKIRERFMREKPGLISANLNNLYKRPEELTSVAAYLLAVPKERLVQIYEKMNSRETGTALLQALDDRLNMKDGNQRLVNTKATKSLTPTNISYFFKELLGSINGIATGFSELSIAFQSQNVTGLPNLEK